MFEKPPNQQQESYPSIRWKRPSIDNLRKESGEFGRVLEEVGGLKKEEASFTEVGKEVATAFLNGEYIQIDDSFWSKIENTDSYDGVPVGNIEKAKEFAYEHERDIDSLLIAIKEGQELPAPIVLDYGEGLHLVAGNTRLMISRALGQYPFVLVGKHSFSKE